MWCLLWLCWFLLISEMWVVSVLLLGKWVFSFFRKWWLILQMILRWCGSRFLNMCMGQVFSVLGIRVWLVQVMVWWVIFQVLIQLRLCLFSSRCISLVGVSVGWVLLRWMVLVLLRLCRLLNLCRWCLIRFCSEVLMRKVFCFRCSLWFCLVELLGQSIQFSVLVSIWWCVVWVQLFLQKGLKVMGVVVVCYWCSVEMWLLWWVGMMKLKVWVLMMLVGIQWCMLEVLILMWLLKLMGQCRLWWGNFQVGLLCVQLLGCLSWWFCWMIWVKVL